MSPRSGAPSEIWVFIFMLTGVCILAWFYGASRFRASCEQEPGWLGALLYFAAMACVISAAGLGALAAVVWCGVTTNGLAIAAALPRVALTVPVVVGLLAGAAWVYRNARRVIHRLQRRCAVKLARHHLDSFS